jgi:hypothetical protein
MEKKIKNNIKNIINILTELIVAADKVNLNLLLI